MSYCLINRNNFLKNINMITQYIDINKIAFVLKNNAYGHGLLEMAQLAKHNNIKHAIVINDKEAEKIKNYFDSILVLSGIPKVCPSKNISIAIVESCTGGLLSKKLTDTPGSSSYLKGSLIAYSDEIKKNILQVSSSRLKKYGAVSSEIALEMSNNISRFFKADFGSFLEYFISIADNFRLHYLHFSYYSQKKFDCPYPYFIFFRLVAFCPFCTHCKDYGEENDSTCSQCHR